MLRRTTYSPNRPMRFFVDGAVVMELPREDALDLLEWLGLGRPEFGAIETRDLLPLCRRRLWPEPRNFDPATPRRPAGTLRLRTELLATVLSSMSASTGIDTSVGWLRLMTAPEPLLRFA